MSGVRNPTAWPQWRVDLLRQLAGKGLSAAQVARELDLDVNAVRRKAKRESIGFNSTTGGNSTAWGDPSRTARLAALVAMGWSSTDIARDLGLSRSCVIARCKRAGLKLQGKRGPKSAHPNVDEPAAGNVVPLRRPDQRTAPASVPSSVPASSPLAARDRMPFLDAVFGRCRMPLWDEGRHVPLEDKFYCGAPVARSGVSWCPACLATISSQPRISLDALAFGKRARRRAFT